ncbi:hypothetical protein DMC30DRAFT_223333 [Rhodotorula diobovata]|uniref:Secreted protein n=1 Tax=Rhodotorula diobovata TaxID=5288 RepID=A0A5C5FW48_9BASI|nr:hypothetical protein DMC30DRAFT_223333 [Rhodotorula diobovata]
MMGANAALFLLWLVVFREDVSFCGLDRASRAHRSPAQSSCTTSSAPSSSYRRAATTRMRHSSSQWPRSPCCASRSSYSACVRSSQCATFPAVEGGTLTALVTPASTLTSCTITSAASSTTLAALASGPS